MMYRILHEGREKFVPDLNGYDDAEVLDENVPEPPCDQHWCDWVDGAWVERVAEREEAEEAARLAALTPAAAQAEAVAKAKAELAAALGITLP